MICSNDAPSSNRLNVWTNDSSVASRTRSEPDLVVLDVVRIADGTLGVGRDDLLERRAVVEPLERLDERQLGREPNRRGARGQRVGQRAEPVGAGGGGDQP